MVAAEAEHGERGADGGGDAVAHPVQVGVLVGVVQLPGGARRADSASRAGGRRRGRRWSRLAGTWRLALTRIATFLRSSSPPWTRARAARSAAAPRVPRRRVTPRSRRHVAPARALASPVATDEVEGARANAPRRDRRGRAESADPRVRAHASRRVDGEPPERGHGARRSVRCGDAR